MVLVVGCWLWSWFLVFAKLSNYNWKPKIITKNYKLKTLFLLNIQRTISLLRGEFMFE